MIISKGNIPYKNRKNEDMSIIDIKLTNYIISVYQGSKGEHPENDIKIVYYENSKSRQGRTPKHIHWAVDLLIKKQFEQQLTNSFIKEIKKDWNNCQILENNNFETLKNIIESYLIKIDLKKYIKLNNYGEYDVEFLLVVLVLMMYEEKTNSHKAHMFNDVLEALLKDQLDIFSIISSATFHG